LPALDARMLEAGVPALMSRRIEARLRALPKASRRQLHPIREVAQRLVARLGASGTGGSLDTRLAAMLATEFGVEVAPDAWADLVEPEFLRPSIRVVDDDGRELARGRDVDALRRELKPQVRAARRPAKDAGTQAAAQPRRDWRFDALPREQAEARGGLSLTVYPALRREGSGVVAHAFLDADEAARAHDDALLALLGFRYAQQLKSIRKALLADREIQLLWSAHDDPGGNTLVDDVQHAALRRTFGERFGDIRDLAAWQGLCDAHAHALVAAGEGVVDTLREVLRAEARCREAAQAAPEHVAEALDDVNAQVGRLVYPGFLAATPNAQLDELPRYLEAARIRLERVASNTARDAEYMAVVASLEARMGAFDRAVPSPAQREAIEAFRWLVEELRVSLFAQVLGTRVKVSAKRLEKRWDEILRLAA
jgi:ATP-dependent helicase HrpA